MEAATVCTSQWFFRANTRPARKSSRRPFSEPAKHNRTTHAVPNENSAKGIFLLPTRILNTTALHLKISLGTLPNNNNSHRLTDSLPTQDSLAVAPLAIQNVSSLGSEKSSGIVLQDGSPAEFRGGCLPTMPGYWSAIPEEKP